MTSFKSLLAKVKKGATPKAPTMQPLGQQHSLTPDDQAALKILREAIRDNFKTVFRGARFVSNDDNAKADAATAIEVADMVLGEVAGLGGYEGVKSTASESPMSVTLTLAKKLTGLDSTPDIVAAIGLGTLRDFYTSVTPFLCCFRGFKEAATTLYGAVDDKRDALRAIEAQPFVLTGDPQAALLAAGRVLDRRGNDKAAQGAMKAVEATVGTALMATGVGGLATSGVSLAGKLGALAVVIHRRGVEYREMKAGAMALGRPDTLSVAVFGTCPLLGCYLLVCSDSSSIYLSALGEGQPARGWMDRVEAAHRYIDPVMEKSRELMAESLYRLEGPNLQKGLTQQGGRITGVAVDRRPWTETFLISHFGTQNLAYKALKKGHQFQEHATKVREKVEQSAWGALEEKVKSEWANVVKAHTG